MRVRKNLINTTKLVNFIKNNLTHLTTISSRQTFGISRQNTTEKDYLQYKDDFCGNRCLYPQRDHVDIRCGLYSAWSCGNEMASLYSAA
jgi:hypothetical protein